MNRSHRASLGLAVILITVGGLCADVARAQNAPLASIPNSMKASTSLSDADRAAIKDFVQRMTDKGAITIPDNRKLLIDGAVLYPDGADPAFLLEYAGDLDDAFMNLLNASPKDVHLKVCIGVVAARVADSAKNSALINTATKLLNDNSEAVEVWGMKTARGIIPFIVNADALSKLEDRVVGKAKAANSGLVVEDAYDALTPDKASQTMQVSLAPKVIGLLQHRVTQFSTDITDQPIAESKPVSFLLLTPMWSTAAGKGGSLSAPERAQVAQLVTNVLWLAAQHLNDPNATPDQQTQLRILIRQISDATEALAKYSFNNLALSNSAHNVNLGVNGAPSSVIADVRGLVEQIFAEPSFGPGLKTPPTIDKDKGGQDEKSPSTTNSTTN